MMEFVNGKDDIPYMKWKIKHVPNHQPVTLMGYPLVMTNSSPWTMALIEIDGLPLKNGWIFHGELLVITRYGMCFFLFLSHGFCADPISLS